MPPFTPDSLDPYLARLEASGHVYVGYSGGLDSTVLLHALCGCIASIKLTAVHVNHQLQPAANSWQEHCRQQCRDWGVSFIARTVEVKIGGGQEEAARDARYQAFIELLGSNDSLLLAHHLDDQVETVLYRLLRGSGPRGLAGIPATRSLGRGRLLRPLLAFSKQQLEQYARQQGLCWVEDSSNLDPAHDRNFIRQKLIPLLRQRWPDCAIRIDRTAAMCRQAESLAVAVADEDLARIGTKPERRGSSIALPGFATLSRERQINLLRRWLAEQGITVPGHRIVDTVLMDLVPARRDAAPLVSWRGGELRRYHGRLFAATNLPVGPCLSGVRLQWDGDSELVLPDGGRLLAETSTGEGLRLPRPGQLEIRFRSGGERCRPVGRSGSNTLKKIFQEYAVEPWLRDRIPLIYSGDKLAAVGDLFVCHGFQVTAGEVGRRPVWRYPVD